MEERPEAQPEKQPKTSEEPQESAGRGGPKLPRRVMLIRYGKMGMLGQFRHSEKEISSLARYVVVKTERGLELGEIVSAFYHHRGRFDLSFERVEEYCSRSGPNYPLSQSGKVVRFATEQDLNEHKHLELNSHKELEYCQGLINEARLPMKLVDVEHLFGGDRIIFYFMADGRVDFRDLVKNLAQQYQTRIEMRQVGARDEARLVGDIETCGRECCCKNFLKILNPVNMRMAKVQKATLDPSKISGTCGRLKCCLRYEDDVYTELIKSLPRRNSCVLTQHGCGTVINTDIMTQQVTLTLDDNSIVMVGVEEIQQFNYKRPEQPDGGSPPAREPSRESNGRRQGVAEVPKVVETNASERREGESAGSSGEPQGGEAGPKKRRRRRRKKKKPQNAQDGSSSPEQPDSNTANTNE